MRRNVRRWWIRLLATSWAVSAAVLTEARADDAQAPRSDTAASLDVAAERMTVPEGFSVNLFAGEPEVTQPIALAFDARGRLWVVECHTYPDWEKSGKPAHDKVIVFEDSDGDGKADKRTVFLDNGTNLSGITLGFGGVWLCATPNLLFVPDRNGDDRPDGPPEVVLDGWDLNARHNVFNGLIWGPDGWLWGCNGILSNSKVGPPGTPEASRVTLNCGVWRYHPTRKVVEVVAHGTTNPWGLDFNELGEAFITNCVIPHLFHVTPGAHFERMFGNDNNPYTYQLIPSCADHVHWDTTERWLDIRTIGVSPTTDRAGGGHAHSGAVIYQGDNWPDEYRGSILMGNIHGRRLNRDRLVSKGSGFVARHAADFLHANDPWFRGIAMKTGPEGALYVLDWSDTGECHEHDADGAHRENGRIYRVIHGKPEGQTINVASADDAKLVELQSHRNDWYAREARRVLQERAAAGKDLAAAHTSLRTRLAEETDDVRRLRMLWALHVSGGLDQNSLARLVEDRSEHVRAWAVRLLVDDRGQAGDAAVLKALEIASADPTPRVRLAVASAMQRLPRGAAIDSLKLMLVGKPEDASDPNLPWMLWYALEPTIGPGLEPLAASAWFATEARIPLLRSNIARRMVEVDHEKSLMLLTLRMNQSPELTADAARDVFAGLMTGLRGRKGLKKPEGWSALAEKARGLDPSLPPSRLALMLGDQEAMARLKALAVSEQASPEARRDAIDALAEARVPGLAPGLLQWATDPVTRLAAIRALAVYDDPAIPRVLLDRFKTLPDEAQSEVVSTLASRPDWALALLESVGSGNVERRDVSVPVARQILAFGKKDLDAALAKHWGALRATAGDKAERMAHFKDLLSPAALKSADLARGRQVFVRTCGSCHQLYQDGHAVGPNLTGSNRDNLDYVLENVLDPSASVANEYKLVNVATTDGRIVSGIIRERTESALVLLATEGAQIVVPRSEIEAERISPASMMPDGLFDKLSEAELRDLVLYLTTKAPVE